MQIYLLATEDKITSEYKIGVTRRETQKRLKESQTGNSETLHIIKSVKVKNGFQIETFIKNANKHLRKNGEWFEFQSSFILDFENLVKKLDANFNILNQTNYYLHKKQKRKNG